MQLLLLGLVSCLFSVLVYVVDWFAFNASWSSTYEIIAFGFSKLFVSVFVSVVDWLALRANFPSTYYVVAFVAS